MIDWYVNDIWGLRQQRADILTVVTFWGTGVVQCNASTTLKWKNSKKWLPDRLLYATIFKRVLDITRIKICLFFFQEKRGQNGKAVEVSTQMNWTLKDLKYCLIPVLDFPTIRAQLFFFGPKGEKNTQRERTLDQQRGVKDFEKVYPCSQRESNPYTGLMRLPLSNWKTGGHIY